MKKVLSTLLVGFLVVLLTGGYLVWNRWRRNVEQRFPFPYNFPASQQLLHVEAPILLVGDRMGTYLARFEKELAGTISQNLANVIKVESIATEGFGIHRTLHQARSLARWPQIVIYQGGSEEFLEKKFELSEIKKINTNIRRYNDSRIETAIILYPWLSRLVYEPMKRITLEETLVPREELPEADYLAGLEMELLLYEQQLIQLVNLARDKGSLLLLTTTPINLDAPPKKVCSFTMTPEVEVEIEDLRKLIRAGNHKDAYNESGKLLKRHVGNARLYYLHGQVSKRLGFIDEARTSLLEASAHDCEPWRSTEVQNAIIRRVAQEHQAILFDFARLVESDWGKTPTFLDETHAQNLYYEKGMQQLGLVIKKILRL